MILMNVYTYVHLFNNPWEYFFAFRIVYPIIYFISFTKFLNSISSHNFCCSLIWLYEFETLHAKVFLENIVNTFEKASVFIWYMTVITLVFQNIIKLFSTSSMFRPVYSFKISEIPINIACIIYRRMVIVFI